MADQSLFRGTIDFMARLGVYDVILPFLLVFTIVFAILEKTRIFGTEEVNNKKYTRKNLNAMVAFVVAFFVVASSQLVAVVTEVSANVVLLLLLSVLFLMLVGSFSKESPEGFFLEGGWRSAFFVIMFIGIFAIFLNAIKTKSGESWLSIIFNFTANIGEKLNSDWVATIVLLVIVIGVMAWITGSSGAKKAEKKD